MANGDSHYCKLMALMIYYTHDGKKDEFNAKNYNCKFYYIKWILSFGRRQGAIGVFLQHRLRRLQADKFRGFTLAANGNGRNF